MLKRITAAGLLLGAASLCPVTNAADEPMTPTSQPATGGVSTMSEPKTTASGLKIVDKGMAEGDSAVAKSGDQVWVEYTGKLQDGTKFDASADHPGQPLIFVLGQHQVIAGWEEGIAGMRVGQKRQLIIPPSLGYGSQAVGSIPANSTLIFDVQLLGLKKG